MHKPQMDIVLLCTGTHGWHISAGWVAAGKRMGRLRKASRPKINWNDKEPDPQQTPRRKPQQNGQ